MKYDGIQHPLAYRAYHPYRISPSKTIASLSDERKLDEFHNFWEKKCNFSHDLAEVSYIFA